jgi:hypothetical protein
MRVHDAAAMFVNAHVRARATAIAKQIHAEPHE